MHDVAMRTVLDSGGGLAVEWKWNTMQYVSLYSVTCLANNDDRQLHNLLAEEF